MGVIMSLIDHEIEDFPVEQGEGASLNEYVRELMNGEIRYLSKRSEKDGGGYAVDLPALSQIVKSRCIENAIFEKLDAVGLRIWRLLLDKGPLEDKMVSISDLLINSIDRQARSG